MKRTGVVALMTATIVTIGVLLSGCSGSDGDTAAVEAGDAQVATIEPGVLMVCTYESPPFEFQTDRGEWTGFDIDLLTAMATDINGGLSLAVTVLPFDGIWLAPAEGTCDVVAAALTITPERAEVTLFTDTYFASGQSLVVLESRSAELTGLDALAGSTIGVLAGSTGAAYADASAPTAATIVEFANEVAMFTALDAGEIDAVLHDLPLNVDRSNSQPGQYALVGEFNTGERFGFVVAKDNTALADALNKRLKAVRTDGSYQEIYDRYFGPVGATTR